MKILSKKELSLLYFRKRTKKQLKRKRKNNKRRIHERRLFQGKTSVERMRMKDSIKFTHVEAPENFSMMNNVEESICFLNKIESLFNKRKEVFVILKNVQWIDHSAITVLLSLMYKFKVAKIGFNGDYPDNKIVERKIIESHFFEKLMRPLSSADDYLLNKENQIFAKANKFVVPEIGIPIMEQVSETVWGVRRFCKGLQRTLLELMQNTNNHASNRSGEVHWWLSVNHDKTNNVVDFYFVDYGQGILKSLENKTSKKIWEGFRMSFRQMLDSSQEPGVIRSLLNGEHRDPKCRKDPYYRGKGLPGIKEVLDRNQISNLHIITNNVFIGITEDKFERLSRYFNGTFYHWQINKGNK